MPFDKSRHLCLQAFPTSILINGGSLRHHHHTTPPACLPDSHLFHTTQHGFWSQPLIRRHAFPHDGIDVKRASEREKKPKPTNPSGPQSLKICPTRRAKSKRVLMLHSMQRSSHSAALVETHRLNPRTASAAPCAVQRAETCARTTISLCSRRSRCA